MRELCFHFVCIYNVPNITYPCWGRVRVLVVIAERICFFFFSLVALVSVRKSDLSVVILFGRERVI